MGRTVTAKEAVRMLELAGWTEVRHTGSHKILRHPDGRTVPVPMHTGDLRPGTLRNIERATGVRLKD